jgi:t-SNARE complex subunit (syntaxin)
MPDTPLTQRDIESLRTTLGEVNRTLRDLPAQLVNKEVWLIAERARDAAMKVIEDDVRDLSTTMTSGVSDLKASVKEIEARRTADRQLLLKSLILPALLIVLQIYLTARIGGLS